MLLLSTEARSYLATVTALQVDHLSIIVMVDLEEQREAYRLAHRILLSDGGAAAYHSQSILELL